MLAIRGLRLFLTLCLLFGSMLAQAKPAIEANLASVSAWTFQPEEGNGAPKPLPVPAGGWRLNGFPNATAGTYERSLTVPKLPGGGEQVTLLAFEAVNWEATVFAGRDTQHLEEVGKHLSAWTPFRIDISKAIAPGTTGIVRVAVRDRTFFKDEKGQFTIPAATEWNDRQARGIIRGVSLQVYPAVYLSDVFVKPSIAANALSYSVTLINATSKVRRVSLSAELQPANPTWKWKYPALPTQDLQLQPNATRQVTVGPIHWTPGRAAWWWPNIPFRPDYHALRHDLTLHLREVQGKMTRLLQTETVRFGFCTPGQQGNTYTLNGVRINLRGDSLPEGTIGTDAFARLPGFLPPTKNNSGWPGAVRNYQRLNYNVIRMHQVPCTRYMMDVCDDLGMLVIPETAIRGGGIKKENIEQNPEAFTTHLRELILRDRNHPSVFKWSLENELFGAPEPFIKHLYEACMETDGTRPCSLDDNADYATLPGFTVVEHYSQPPGTPDAAGGKARTDRPFGQGEYVWPFGAAAQGPLWFALTTRALREHENADIRPYTLIDVWPGVIPGLTPTNFPDPHLPPDSLEQGGHSLLNPAAPWTDPRLLLIQRSFAPVAAYDRDYDILNTPSNGHGEWPALSVVLPSGKTVMRRIEVFNDEFDGEILQVSLQPTLYLDADKTQSLPAITRSVNVKPGNHAELSIPLVLPVVKENRTLVVNLSVSKNGKEQYREQMLGVIVPETGGTEGRYEGRDEKTAGNWVGAYGKQGFLIPTINGQANFQMPGITLQRGVGFLPDRLSHTNLLNQYGPLQSELYQFERGDTVNDVRVPVRAPGLPERVPTAFKGSGNGLVMRVDIKDDQPRRVSLYLLDYLKKGWAIDADIFDLRGNRLDTRRVDNFGGGVYLRYRIKGSIIIRLTSLGNDEAALSGLFIDPSE